MSRIRFSFQIAGGRMELQRTVERFPYVPGDPAVLDALRALQPELDTFANVPAPTLVRLHQDPEEPMPYVSESALSRAFKSQCGVSPKAWLKQERGV